MAVDHWRSYLQQGPFLIQTDQGSLEHLSDQRLTTPWQLKAYTKLLGLDYKIVYRKGTANSVADALSRLPTATHAIPMDLYALSTSQPVWK